MIESPMLVWEWCLKFFYSIDCLGRCMVLIMSWLHTLHAFSPWKFTFLCILIPPWYIEFILDTWSIYWTSKTILDFSRYLFDPFSIHWDQLLNISSGRYLLTPSWSIETFNCWYFSTYWILKLNTSSIYHDCDFYIYSWDNPDHFK